MNTLGYRLGVFYRIWTVVSFPLCLVLFIIYILTHGNQQIVYTIAPVISIAPDGKTILLESKTNSTAFNNAAIYLADRVSKILFSYSNDGQYAASAANISNVFDENSKASRTFREVIQKNLSDAKLGNSVFTLDYKKTIASLDPNNPGIMVVLAEGFQTISNSSGTTTRNIKVNYVMYFNEKRGSDGDVYKITDISFN